MKRISTVLVLALAFALVASVTLADTGYQFTKTLKKGSRGADVVALQTLLESKNLLTMPAGVAKGYFGALTVSAVKAYQASKGISTVGQVGPATRAALNLEGSVVTLPGGTTVPGGTTATAGISTPGVAGTLATSLWTSPSGVTAYKGQSADFAGYKLQAAASDMAVTSLSFDFDTRFWLYANNLTVKDETGRVVGQVSNLNASNFTELTVGSQYRINVPVTGLVVKATQIKYLTVGASFNPVSDRSSGTINVTQAQIRAVDGTGVTDTQNASGGSRSFTYQGTNIGQLVVTTDSASPVSQVVQVSTAAQTQNVPLAIFDIKSQNQPGTLQTLTVDLSISSTTGSGVTTFAVGDIFSNVQVKVGNLTYSASSLSTSSATFTNMSVPLSADVYTPVTVLATLAQNTNNRYNGTVVRVGLTTSSSNPSVIDATYNNVTPSSIGVTVNGNYLTFSSAGVTVGSLATTLGNTVANQGASSTKDFTFTYSLTAGNNPIYVSATATTALATSTTGNVGTVSLVSFRSSDSTGDVANQYFYLAPGQTKTFTATFSSKGNPGAVAGTYSVTGLNYGTGFANGAVTGTGTLNAPVVGSTLFASLSY